MSAKTMAKRAAALAFLAGFAGGASAAPRVATDIAPVQSVVARVMAGVGAPDLVVRPGASPHGYALRPSEAQALARADVVFWVGPSLTPWLEEALDTLAPGAEKVRLSEAPGVTRLTVRTGAAFPPHEHEHADDDGHDADHDHADHDHADHDDGHDHDHADHDDDHHEDEDHHTHAGGVDPHMWLDPMNAAAWAEDVAEVLAAKDPENAALYRSNAAAARAEYQALTDAVSAELVPVSGAPFLVFHDAYQYFESRFDMHAAGAVSVSEATRPGAARVAEAREAVLKSGARCVFAEPQFKPALVETVIEGSNARSGVLDPVGAGIEPGPAFYPALIRKLAAGLLGCLSAGG